jgi:hypothetical protein
MNKNETPYINEDSVKSKSSNPGKFKSKISNLTKSRSAKITAISVGSAVALGVAFTGGVVFGKVADLDDHGPGFAEKFDRDGDHKFSGDGQRPPRPDHAPDGDRDGFGPGDQQQGPETTSPNTTTP